MLEIFREIEGVTGKRWEAGCRRRSGGSQVPPSPVFHLLFSTRARYTLPTLADPIQSSSVPRRRRAHVDVRVCVVPVITGGQSARTRRTSGPVLLRLARSNRADQRRWHRPSLSRV